jgi:DNA-directed RNA polymerase specialized sigma24 family protein
MARATDGPQTTGDSAKRELADRILGRANWLARADQLLIEQTIGRGVATKDTARLMHCSTRTIQRRVRQISQRLTDPMVLRIMREGRRWPAPTGEVARRYFVQRQTLRQIAAGTGLTLHHVRKHLDRARGILDAR